MFRTTGDLFDPPWPLLLGTGGLLAAPVGLGLAARLFAGPVVVISAAEAEFYYMAAARGYC